MVLAAGLGCLWLLFVVVFKLVLGVFWVVLQIDFEGVFSGDWG